MKVQGTVDAVDKEKGTVTLKAPKRTLTLAVKDKSKLDAIQVGDPVVATYVEAVAFQVRKAGSRAPGVSVRRSGNLQAGRESCRRRAREIAVTATIDAIDKKAQTVTIKGPEGNAETIKVKNPKNLEGVKVGDLVDITYTQALAVALDKPAPVNQVGRSRGGAAAWRRRCREGTRVCALSETPSRRRRPTTARAASCKPLGAVVIDRLSASPC